MMKKPQAAVKEATGYIAVCVLLFSALMQAVFLILSRWRYPVLLGNLLGAFAAVANFFFMGMGIQSATEKEEKGARATVRASQAIRLFFLFLCALIGVLLPCFDTLATLLPLFFPRIAISFRPLFQKGKKTPPENNG